MWIVQYKKCILYWMWLDCCGLLFVALISIECTAAYRRRVFFRSSPDNKWVESFDWLLTDDNKIMEADVINALKSKLVYIPGSRDYDSNLIIVYQLPFEIKPWTRRYLEISTKYLLSAVSSATLKCGFVALVDAQKCPWRSARDEIKFIERLLDEHLIRLFVLRTEAFSMQNCAKTYKKGEVSLHLRWWNRYIMETSHVFVLMNEIWNLIIFIMNLRRNIRNWNHKKLNLSRFFVSMWAVFGAQ